MKTTALLFALLGVAIGIARTVENRGSVGAGQGIILPTFAERCEGCGSPCGMQLLLAGTGDAFLPCDLYVRASACGSPGNLLSMTAEANPRLVASWPSISTHDVALGSSTSFDGVVWLSYWSDHTNEPCGYSVAADVSPVSGWPHSTIVPGIGYPTGWNNVSVVSDPTQATGVGGWVLSDDPQCLGEGVPTKESTWGKIKTLYN